MVDRVRIRLFILSVLFLAGMLVWSAVYAVGARVLAVSFLDVGQGDAIFIETPHGNQVLIDASAGRMVLPALSEMMPFYDTDIDMIIATHPDKDHIGGFPDVLEKFAVSAALRSGAHADTAAFQSFNEHLSAEEGLVEITARAGMRLILDDGVVLEILFPDRDVSEVEANTASIVARLSYGGTAFLFTGDAPQSIERYLAGRYGAALRSDVLKLGHHGSHTSSAEVFLGFVSPEVAIVSAGLDNRYGHPHEEVMDRLAALRIRAEATYERGTIRCVSDGAAVACD